MKMKAPAESGQASWSQISRTWLKHVATSTADELCLAWGSGSSYATKHTSEKTFLLVKYHSEGPCTPRTRRRGADMQIFSLQTKQEGINNRHYAGTFAVL